MRTERRNLHGTPERCEVYDMPGEGWEAITDVPCPVASCAGVVRWYEAGTVPGYRRCTGGHRFQGDPRTATLVRDACCEAFE